MFGMRADGPRRRVSSAHAEKAGWKLTANGHREQTSHVDRACRIRGPQLRPRQRVVEAYFHHPTLSPASGREGGKHVQCSPVPWDETRGERERPCCCRTRPDLG